MSDKPNFIKNIHVPVRFFNEPEIGKSYLIYPVSQLNSQIRFGPPEGPNDRQPLNVPLPGPGTEVYVNGIPPDHKLEEIFSLFMEIGIIHTARFVISFSSKSKGFGFIRYLDADTADRAIALLDQKQIVAEVPADGASPAKPAKCLKVTLSKDQRSLVFSNIPDVGELARLILNIPGLPRFSNERRSENDSIIIDFNNNRDMLHANKLILTRLRAIQSPIKVTKS